MATHMTAEISDVSANTTLVNMEKSILASFTVKSFIRGYHVYKEDWEPELNEEQELKREPQNKEDPYAVAVVRPLPRPPKDNDPGQAPCSSAEGHPNAVQRNEEVIGHIPLRMASCVSKFLKRRTNKGKVVVTGKRVNRGAGYGLEIPCEYIFFGDNETSIPWLKSKIESLGYKLD